MTCATKQNSKDLTVMKAQQVSRNLSTSAINPLLSKFKAVKVSPLDMIDGQDRQFVETIDAEYINVIAQLNQWKEHLEKVSELLPKNDFVHLEKTNYGGLRVEKDHSGERTEKKWFNSLLFSPVYAFKYIADNLELARAFRNRDIVEHFNKRYNLEIPDDNNISFDLETIERVIEYIFSRTGGKGLFQKGKENNISSMKHYFKEPVLESESITFPASRYGSRWPENQLSNKNTLGEALSLFENDALSMSEEMMAFIDGVSHAGTLYQYAPGIKFKSLRYYKNGKRTIYFADSAAAQEFFQLFQYEQVEK